MENYEDQITLLYFAIILAQIFNDGNGRTALLLFYYFTQNKLDFDIFQKFEDKNGKIEFISKHKQILLQIVLNGITRLFRTIKIIDETQNLASMNGNEEGSINAIIYDNGKKLIGHDSYIKFLALYFLLLSKDIVLDPLKGYDIKDLTLEDRQKFDVLYKRLKNMMFGEYIMYVNENLLDYKGLLIGMISDIQDN